MARAGDTYTITLKKSHVKWGDFRYTHSRGTVYGEGYIPIPAKCARAFNLRNQNGVVVDTLGLNLFNCRSKDGFFDDVVRTQGCSKAGYVHAKQFASDGNLKGLGDWFVHVGAAVGDRVKVTWVSSTDIVIEKL